MTVAALAMAVAGCGHGDATPMDAGRADAQIPDARDARSDARVDAADDAATRGDAAVDGGAVRDGGIGLVTHTCAGRSFYVDFAGGDDSNDGTTTMTPWKRAPGMVGFAGTYIHQSHDCFYFKGGVTWPNAVFPLTVGGGGDATANTYYGPDGSWFSGASWSRPIFDAQGSRISGPYNDFIRETADYVTVDDLEFTGWFENSNPGYGRCVMISLGAGTHDLIDHIYVHDFSDTYEPSVTNCMVVQAKTYGDEGGEDTIQNSVFAGDPNSYMEVGRAINYWHDNVMHDFIGMMFPGGGHDGEIDGNLAYNCGYPSFPPGATGHHADMIQSNPTETKPFSLYIHDNVFHGTGADSAGNECELALLGNPGETDYIWNNVAWDVQGNAFGYPQAGSVGDGYYAWNNSVDASISNNRTYCFRGKGMPASVDIQNNFCIAAFGATSGLAATQLVVNHNLYETHAEADAAGYTKNESPYAYYPPAPNSVTVGAGADLSTLCKGALAGLCYDTTYGAEETPGHRVQILVRAAVARPAGAAWDVGAYER